MKFVHWKELFNSLQVLMQLGGKFARAAAQVAGVLNNAQRKSTTEEVFYGIPTTNHGESRIQHCVKYDLQGACRLITVQHNGICFLMYAGTHDECDRWLETNKGMRFHLKEIDGRDVLESTRVSDDVTNPDHRLRSLPDFSSGQLWEKLPLRYFDTLCKNLPEELTRRLKMLTSTVSEDELFDLAMDAEGRGDVDTIFDVFDLLRSGAVHEAKARIDLAKGAVKPVEQLTSAQVAKVSSGDEVVLNDDVDPILFEHFLRTASFQKWMVYLHPGQREFVNRDFNGPARLAGVSGSGKTSVLIHRALRLAKMYPDERVVVITLNRALARLIGELTTSATAGQVPSNLEVHSFWEVCQSRLLRLEPQNRLSYWDKTVKTNKFAQIEHIDEIWTEYYQCRNNNDKAKVLAPLHRTLLNRNIYPADYIRQEFDYLRSALAPRERGAYTTLEREGRSVPLEERYRKNVMDGLSAWEEKMTSVGAVDYLGLATALYKHIDKITPEYRCALIDEMQDFGCVELRIIRALVEPGPNDIFLCGDLAQSVLTKHHKLSEAGIDVVGRSHSIRKNYRNSREILTAAFALFKTNEALFTGATNVEILNPEFANFSSSPPLLLSSTDLESELSHALGYLRDLLGEAEGQGRKYCVAICGQSPSDIEKLGDTLCLPVLTGDTDVVAGQIFISDLEQTKGFEFDSVIIINCSADVLPHPALPVEESYRDLCKLYVAMTRAKTELIISFSGQPSPFLSNREGHFTAGDWTTYASAMETMSPLSPVGLHANGPHCDLLHQDAQQILFSREAVGLSSVAQEKLLQIVTGTNRFKQRRKVEWRSFGEFYSEVGRAAPLRGYNGISDQVWAEFERLNARVSNSTQDRSDPVVREQRPILSLPKRDH